MNTRESARLHEPATLAVDLDTSAGQRRHPRMHPFFADGTTDDEIHNESIVVIVANLACPQLLLTR